MNVFDYLDVKTLQKSYFQSRMRPLEKIAAKQENLIGVLVPDERDPFMDTTSETFRVATLIVSPDTLIERYGKDYIISGRYVGCLNEPQGAVFNAIHKISRFIGTSDPMIEFKWDLKDAKWDYKISLLLKKPMYKQSLQLPAHTKVRALYVPVPVEPIVMIPSM